VSNRLEAILKSCRDQPQVSRMRASDVFQGARRRHGMFSHAAGVSAQSPKMHASTACAESRHAGRIPLRRAALGGLIVNFRGYCWLRGRESKSGNEPARSAKQGGPNADNGGRRDQGERSASLIKNGGCCAMRHVFAANVLAGNNFPMLRRRAEAAH
jgi:hypothetical protein